MAAPTTEDETPGGRDRRSTFRAYRRAVGPGLVAGASDDDPSAIATYASAASQVGFGLLWTSVVALPLLIAVQVNVDRTAMATGRTVGELARQRYGRRGRGLFALLMVAQLVANTVVIGADLIAVGAGLELLVGGPPWLWALVAGAAVSGLVLKGSFETVARVLKALCLAVLGYVLVLFVVDVSWGEVLHRTFVPDVHLDGTYIGLLVAVLGATFPPFVFYWQSAHRLEEMRAEPLGDDEPVSLPYRAPEDATLKRRTSTLDVAFGMVFACAVMFAVMVATAAARQGGGEIGSAADVAAALEPIAGGAAKALFAVGFVSAGLLAIPVLAGSASAGLAGVLGREWGFSRGVRDAPFFYALVAGGTVIGSVLSVLGVDPIRLLVAAATANGITAAPLLAVLMVVAGDRTLLGEHRPHVVARALGWAAVALMGLATLALAVTALR